MRHRGYSEETAREIDIEVRRILDEQIKRVGQLLEERKPVLMRAARSLIAKETITGAELRAIAVAAGETDSEEGQPPTGTRAQRATSGSDRSSFVPRSIVLELPRRRLRARRGEDEDGDEDEDDRSERR